MSPTECLDMSDFAEKRPRVRAAVAVLHEGRVLLVEHTKDDRRYWLLPGGGLDWGESLHQAACREVAEETGVTVKAGELMFVSETLAPDGSKHVIHLVFKATYLGGELRVPAEERITDVQWVELEKVKELTLHPPMQEALVRIRTRAATDDRVFLGNLWVD